MFTGIVRHTGRVAAADPREGGTAALKAECPPGFLDDKEVGDSVCVNGCCLTLTGIGREGNMAEFDLGPETLARTAPLSAGDPVHLEGSLRVGDQVGGHFVLGHVDGVAEVLSVEEKGGSVIADLSVPEGADPRLVVPRASVSVAGVSLTVSAAEGGRFSVQLIPKTMELTHLTPDASLAEGKKLNLEVDYLARFALPGVD